MKRTLFTLMVTALAVPCLADDVPALTIKTTEAEKTIVLASIAKVTYTDTAMVIFLKDSSTQTFDMDHITAMTFTATDVATQIGTLKEDAAVGTAIYTLGGVRTRHHITRAIRGQRQSFLWLYCHKKVFRAHTPCELVHGTLLDYSVSSQGLPF